MGAKHRLRLKLPEELHDLDVDRDVWYSIRHYLWYGLDPGSYGLQLLKGDYDAAIRSSHQVIRMWRDDLNRDVTANMIRGIQVFPDVCHSHEGRILQWIERGGLEAQPGLWPLFRLAL